MAAEIVMPDLAAGKARVAGLEARARPRPAGRPWRTPDDLLLHLRLADLLLHLHLRLACRRPLLARRRSARRRIARILLLGLRRKRKSGHQHDQWKDDPASLGCVHSGKPPSWACPRRLIL